MVAGGGGSSGDLALPIFMRNMTEKSQTTMLDRIAEDCESGDTAKSIHVDEVIK